MRVRVQEIDDDGAVSEGRDWTYDSEVPPHLTETGFVCAAIAWMRRTGEKGDAEVAKYLEDEWCVIREGFSNGLGEEIYQVHPAVSAAHFPVFKMSRNLAAIYRIYDDMEAEIPVGTVRILSS